MVFNERIASFAVRHGIADLSAGGSAVKNIRFGRHID